MEEKKITISEEELRALINLAAEDICNHKAEMLCTDCKNIQVIDIGASISARVQMHFAGKWPFEEERIEGYLRASRFVTAGLDLFLNQIIKGGKK